MTKKTKLNIIMTAIICVLVAGGIILVGSLRGWFGTRDTALATVERVVGVVNIERGGIAYRLEKDMELLPGDKLETAAKAWTAFDGTTLAEESELSFDENGEAELSRGLIFSRMGSLSLMGCHIEAAEGSVFVADSLTGSANVMVLAGEVAVTRGEEGQTASAGETVSILTSGLSVMKLEAGALNDFTIGLAKEAPETLCFSTEELDGVIAFREAEKLAAAKAAEEAAKAKDKEKETETEEPSAEESGEGTGAGADNKPADNKPTDSGSADNKKPDTTKPDEGKPEEPASEETEPAKPTYNCTIQIRCDTILNNWDNLEPDKAGYVPGSGCILGATSVEFTEGETVFDVLNRVCGYYGIQIEYSWTPMYGSYYIEGINHLYEFDCGSQSGWMYKVNGWFPNYGCSSYTLSDGDNIVWCYTCNGLGADVGASMGW